MDYSSNRRLVKFRINLRIRRLIPGRTPVHIAQRRIANSHPLPLLPNRENDIMGAVTPISSLERTVPKLSLEEVEHIAELARLSLNSAEKEMFRDQLSAILDYADMLNRLDTSGVSPADSALWLSSGMRPDEVTPSLSTGEALANAPDADANQFRVQAILE
jgi:aspartyl-tRNA(Asn)/glutamyl-tRNA(Gln) amidotransferase subunit C